MSVLSHGSKFGDFMRAKTAIILGRFAAAKGVSKRKAKREWMKTPRNIRRLSVVETITMDLNQRKGNS